MNRKIDLYSAVIEHEHTDPFMKALLEKYHLKKDWEIIEKEWNEHVKE